MYDVTCCTNTFYFFFLCHSYPVINERSIEIEIQNLKEFIKKRKGWKEIVKLVNNLYACLMIEVYIHWSIVNINE